METNLLLTYLIFAIIELGIILLALPTLIRDKTQSRKKKTRK